MDSKTTEDEIMSGLNEAGESNNADTGTDDTTTTTNDSNDAGTGTDKPAPQSGDDKKADSIERTIERMTGEDNKGQPKDSKGTGTQQQDKRAAQHKPQDLVDERGQVIATGGRERRFYETAQRERARADNLDGQLRQANARIDAFEKANAIGTQLNLTPQEVVTGANLMAALKRDPVQAAQYILTQVRAAGHNVDDIAGGATDMGAIRNMIAELIAPLTSEHKAREVEVAARREASDIYNGFVARYPDAKIHDASIARLLANDSSLSPEAAYFKLKSFYLERGLDFNKPLDVLQKEIDAKRASEQQQQGERGDSIPAGGRAASTVIANQDASFDANAQTSDIVKAAMREAGMNVSNI